MGDGEPSEKLPATALHHYCRTERRGKTTFAQEYLPRDVGVIHFVNMDSIAGGLSPLNPELAAVSAGRLYLAELDRLARACVSFSSGPPTGNWRMRGLCMITPGLLPG